MGIVLFIGKRRFWDINETEARHLCEILLKKGVLDYYTDIKINNETEKRNLKYIAIMLNAKIALWQIEEAAILIL